MSPIGVAGPVARTALVGVRRRDHEPDDLHRAVAPGAHASQDDLRAHPDPTVTRLGVAAALTPEGRVPGDVEVVDGMVTAVGLDPPAGTLLAAPGLVDLQVNGYAGVDVARADVAELVALRRAVARDGVTALAPTLISAGPDATAAALARLDRARAVRVPGGAHLLGAHLEGPFLSPARTGTHPPAARRDPDPALLTRLLDAGRVDLLTLAPELAGARAVVDAARSRGVVVLAGHSDADADAAHAGFAAGVAGVTHLFNAMSGVHHRTPGLATVALARPDTVVTVIADGHHVAPDALGLVAAAVPGRWALITDATSAAGQPDGHYTLGDVPVTLVDGAVRNAAGGLAGAAASLVHGVRTAAGAGIEVDDALAAAGAVPRRLLGLDGRAGLRPGAPADVVVLDPDLVVVRTLVNGREAPP